jgi:hypothetical protein
MRVASHALLTPFRGARALLVSRLLGDVGISLCREVLLAKFHSGAEHSLSQIKQLQRVHHAHQISAAHLASVAVSSSNCACCTFQRLGPGLDAHYGGWQQSCSDGEHVSRWRVRPASEP